jgi:hypothetical protein
LGVQGDQYSYLDKGDWQGQIAHRWLHSDRHFIGTEEQKHRQAEGSEVVNDVHTIDLTATYGITKRLSLNFSLPFVSATRSSLYEHDRTNRHTMSAGGVGDIRLVANYWVFDPEKYTDGNISLGAGVKAPTGDYKTADIKYRPTGPVLDYVDNSIQPGDGGWGALLEFAGYQKVLPQTFLYANATYLFQPEGMNSIGNSIWDAYVARLGLHYAILPEHGLAFSLGGRIEGVPPEDAIGTTEGRRRPGYAISIEPGVSWTYKRLSLNVTAPVAIERNRQNYLGRPGDAAFADYLILSSITYRF